MSLIVSCFIFGLFDSNKVDTFGFLVDMSIKFLVVSFKFL